MKHEVKVHVEFSSIHYELYCSVSFIDDGGYGWAAGEISWRGAPGMVTVWCENDHQGTVADSKMGNLPIGGMLSPEYIYLIAHAYINGSLSCPDESKATVYASW